MTPEEQTKYIDQLKSDVSTLEAWKKNVESQQVDFPLDATSQVVVYQDLMVPTGNVVIPYNLVTYDEYIQVNINGKKYYLVTSKIQP